MNLGQQICIILGSSIVLCLIAMEIFEGEHKVGDFVLMYGFITQIYTPLQAIGVYYDTIKQAIIDIEGVFALLNEKPEISDQINALKLEYCRGDIEFENMSFTYSTELPLVLEKISFKIEAKKLLEL